jgi:DNA-binding CsgD family transcriptional regulator
VLLRDPETSSPRAGVLQEVFGLTPTEAKLAAALCRGACLSDVAIELAIGLSTVRSHLKSVMLKTNTRRQAELVALLFSAFDPAA